jgi:hypothetical protein
VTAPEALCVDERSARGDALEGRARELFGVEVQENAVRIRAAALVTCAHGVQRRRKFGSAAFLGETHLWVDASVVVTPAADGVSLVV